MTDKDVCDPLVVDDFDPLKKGRILFEMIQAEQNAFPFTYMIVKDNKSTYDKFLRHIFEFGQDMRDVGVPELGCKPFRVSEPQDMKISQMCMNRGGAANQIP
jgi:hypothetical protein